MQFVRDSGIQRNFGWHLGDVFLANHTCIDVDVRVRGIANDGCSWLSGGRHDCNVVVVEDDGRDGCDDFQERLHVVGGGILFIRSQRFIIDTVLDEPSEHLIVFHSLFRLSTQTSIDHLFHDFFALKDRVSRNL